MRYISFEIILQTKQMQIIGEIPKYLLKGLRGEAVLVFTDLAGYAEYVNILLKEEKSLISGTFLQDLVLL